MIAAAVEIAVVRDLGEKLSLGRHWNLAVDMHKFKKEIWGIRPEAFAKWRIDPEKLQIDLKRVAKTTPKLASLDVTILASP